MIHLANFSQAMTRQVDESLAGRLIDMYDGGRAARDARSKQAPGGPPRR
jgi:maleylpyruvate isomerase